MKPLPTTKYYFPISVTRLGDLLFFGQLFKAHGNNYFAQIAHILDNFCKVVGIFHFAIEINFWATFIDNRWFFIGHTVIPSNKKLGLLCLVMFSFVGK